MISICHLKKNCINLSNSEAIIIDDKSITLSVSCTPMTDAPPRNFLTIVLIGTWPKMADIIVDKNMSLKIRELLLCKYGIVKVDWKEESSGQNCSCGSKKDLLFGRPGQHTSS